jgi:microsomal dipeptidase-like Zn-dependent dipeptidase
MGFKSLSRRIGSSALLVALSSIAMFSLAARIGFAQAPQVEYDKLVFQIATGNDDLRGDSSATAMLESPNGTVLQKFTLKAQNAAGWNNNTSHTVSIDLKPARKGCEMGHIAITLTSHNSWPETGDNWNVQGLDIQAEGSGHKMQLLKTSGNPLFRLTGDNSTFVVQTADCMANAPGLQQGTGRLRGFVDLHTHPLSNLGFGGKVIYGGVDVGALLPADPDCHHNVRAESMEQALGHDGSTHGGWNATNNSCGDLIREQVVSEIQSMNTGAANPGGDSEGAPSFKDWPVWNDILHQKMWVDWLYRSYQGGLRVMVALAVNNKTIADMTAGPGDYPTDDKSEADRQIDATKEFVSRHSNFMEIAMSSADVERIVRANKLAIVLGVEIDNIGNLNRSKSLTNAEISAEVNRLYAKGVRYIFPIHLIDNPFGGTALYQNIFNYSNDREAGHWWSPTCAAGIDYKFAPTSSAMFTAGVLAKLGTTYNPPNYPACPKGSGEVNSRGLTPQGQFAIKEMMRHGMLIDIDHMSDKSQTETIQIATAVPGGYPLNSGHNALRGAVGDERAMTAAHYAEIGKLHGMAGVGSSGTDAYAWADAYRQVIAAMGNGAVAGFGTDTDGMAMGMKPRKGSAVRYDDGFPRSVLGNKWWDYNKDGVAHYGMLPDFLKDVETAPAKGPGNLSGKQLVDDNLMYGADYFVQTWSKCEKLKGIVK